MELNQYQQYALRTCGVSEPTGRILNGVMGLAGESGECIDLMKKHLFQGHELNREKLKDELGDVLWYIAVCADGLGLDLDAIAQHNVDKLKKRYPSGFDADRSINREE
jgi:NTP pyrophosphatase (non-canonical NTP hydrolase)